MSIRTQILILVTVAVIGGAVILVTRTNNPVAASPITLEKATIDRSDVGATLSASGSLQANQSIALSFQMTGKVALINVKQGDHVLKGQLIAALDDQSALDNLLLAQAKVNTAQVALRRLTDAPRQVDVTVYKTAVNLAQAQLDEALHSVDRIQSQLAQLNVDNAKNGLWVEQLNRDAQTKLKADLVKNGLVNQANAMPSINTAEDAALTSKDFDIQVAQANLEAAQTQTGNQSSISAAQAQMTAAKNALDRLLEGGDKQDIARAQASLQSAQTALNQSKDVLNKTKIVAPFDGVIARLNLNLGEQTPVGPAAIVLDTSAFYVDLQIDEADIAGISTGQAVTLKFAALPDITLPGSVIRIGDSGTTVGGVVTYTVRVEIAPANQPLISSMTTTATIVTAQAKNAVRIPNRFVVVDRSTGKAYVTLQQADGSGKTVEIALGIRSGAWSEVKSGLQAGDVVILPQNASQSAPAGRPGSESAS